MENNCSREIYDLLSENSVSKEGHKNVFKCIQAGHRKLAASIINDMQQSSRYGFNKLHHQVNQIDFDNRYDAIFFFL